VQRYEPLTLGAILDGAANTLLVADKRLNLALLGQAQDDDNEGYTVGWNEDTIRKTSDPPKRDYMAPTGDGEKLFGSSHPTAINVACVDASVRSVSYTVAEHVFARLGDRADGRGPGAF
jgi:hypothetical protein